MKKIFSVTIILYLTFMALNAQDCQNERKQFYFIHLTQKIKGEPDKIGTLIFEELGGVNLSKDSISEFICELYSKGIYLVPPGLDFEEKIIHCIKRDNDQQNYYEEEYMQYAKYTSELGRNATCKKIYLKDNTKIIISVKFIEAELWKIPKSQKTDINHVINFDENCCKSEYYYSIKKYILVRELNKVEKHAFNVY